MLLLSVAVQLLELSTQFAFKLVISMKIGAPTDAKCPLSKFWLDATLLHSCAHMLIHLRNMAREIKQDSLTNDLHTRCSRPQMFDLQDVRQKRSHSR